MDYLTCQTCDGFGGFSCHHPNPIDEMGCAKCEGEGGYWCDDCEGDGYVVNG